MILEKFQAKLDICLSYLNTLHNRLDLDIDQFYVEACEQMIKSIKYELNKEINNNNKIEE